MIDSFFVSLYQKNTDPIATKETVDKVYKLVSEKNYLYLNIILGKANINRMDDVIIVAILRASFESRVKLSHWNSFHNKAKRKLAGTDKEKYLIGLE